MNGGPDREGVVIGVSACRSASLYAYGNAVDKRLQGSCPPVADGELLVLVTLATEEECIPIWKIYAKSGVGEASRAIARKVRRSVPSSIKRMVAWTISRRSRLPSPRAFRCRIFAEVLTEPR